MRRVFVVTWDRGIVEGYQADWGGPVLTLIRGEGVPEKEPWDPVGRLNHKLRKVIREIEKLKEVDKVDVLE